MRHFCFATLSTIILSLSLQASVTISPRAVSLTFTQTQQFTSNTSVTWSVTGGSITSGGLYTPPKTVGSFTVKATSTAIPTQSASATVYITNYAGTYTYHFDNGRSGLNYQETVLTPANVNVNQFGKLFSCGVDAFINAQPLYVANLSIPNKGTHNVVYVVTENDSVYAYDADARSCSLLWFKNFTNSSAGITAVPAADVGDQSTAIRGITSTPVIDFAHKTMFVVARTKENGKYVQRLHALDITTGAERLGGPIVITASVKGTGQGSTNGSLTFDPLHENNRAALLFANSEVYIAFGSLSDITPYHGWLLGYLPNYTANTLPTTPTTIFNATPNGAEGALWNVGALAADNLGNVFCGTGNGDFNPAVGSYGQSWLRLNSSGGVLTRMDSFTPFNVNQLNGPADLDVGSSGPVLITKPMATHPNLMYAGSKQGAIYVMDRTNLGGFNSTKNQNLQTINTGGTTGPHPQYTAAAYWNGHLYFAGEGPLQSYSLSSTTGLLTFLQQTAASFSFYENPIVSANLLTNGIVWLVERRFVSSTSIGILHAYNAANITQELYNSTLNSTRDNPNGFLRFQPPIVANGKVYLAERNASGNQGQLVAYGLLP